MNKDKIIEQPNSRKAIFFYARFGTEKQLTGGGDDARSNAVSTEAALKSGAAREAICYARTATSSASTGQPIQRQLESARRHAQANGLNLVRTILEDGASAFNAGPIRLGVFLQEVKAGKIKPGTVLLVDSMDRFSPRTRPGWVRTMAELFSAGIELVTLTDGRKCSLGGAADPNARWLALGGLMAAHNESRARSLRMKAVWAQRRRPALLLKPTAHPKGRPSKKP